MRISRFVPVSCMVLLFLLEILVLPGCPEKQAPPQKMGAIVNYGSGASSGGSGTTTASVASVKVASSANLTLSGTQTIDGVAAGVGDRVLAAGQSTASQIGPYVVASGAWARTTDFASASQMVAGVLVPVTSGTLYGGTVWVFRTTGAITVGSTSLSFTQVSPPSFGTDTTLQLPNASSNLVTSWQGTNTLTTSTAGSEASKYLVKLLAAGAQANALSLETTQIGVPDKIFFNGETTTFINRPSTGRFEFTGAGVLFAILNSSGLTMNSLPISPGSTSSISYNGAGSIVITPTNRHVQLGAAGAHATTDVGGYVTIAGTPGLPTGVPGNLATGHVPMAIDTTNGKPCWFYSAGWHCTVAALTP